MLKMMLTNYTAERRRIRPNFVPFSEFRRSPKELIGPGAGHVNWSGNPREAKQTLHLTIGYNINTILANH